MNPKNFASFWPAAAVAIVLLCGSGCSKQTASTPVTTPVAAQPATDSQITGQVQARIQAESALGNLPIQVQATKGVVTLSGTVNNQAARDLAANDAAQVAGVRTVVNNLVVQEAQASKPAAPAESAEQRRKAEEQARLRKERARKLRAQQEQQQQAENSPPPPPPAAEPVSQPQPAAPPPPPPPPQPVQQTVVIPAGTDLAVRISENLETGKTQANDAFHGVLVDSLMVNGVTAIPRGAAITGRVIDAKDATHFKGNSELSLDLEQVKTQNKMLALSTDPLVRKGTARGKNTAVKAGGGALLGTLVGALAGGGKGALIGAAAGAGAGAGVNAVTRGEQVKIPSETILHFKLSGPLSVTVTTMSNAQPIPSYNSGDNPQLQPRN